jgi:serine/threonine protein kinase
MDIWSLGIIAYKLMAKKEPYMQLSDLKRSKAIQENQRDQLPEYYSQALRNLVDYLLIVDPDKRPTIEQVLR